MADSQQNPKEKYTNLFQEIREAKNINNLQKIYADLIENKSNLLDNDIIPFQFSNDLIWIISNHLIDLKIQSDIFKLYIDAFFTFKVKPENLQKLTLLDQIFKYDSFLYKTTADTEDISCFVKKYFDKYFPKKNKIKLEKGEIVDVLIAEKDLLGDLLYGWTQLPIKRIEKNYIIFNDYDDENRELKFLIDSYEVQEKNTFTTEEEMNWRKELKRGMKVDFLNNRRLWVESNVLNVLSNNAVVSVLGAQPGDNAIKSIYSPLIRPFPTFSFKFEETEQNYFQNMYYNSYFSKFNYCLPVPKIVEDKDTNFLIPNSYLPYHCLYFYDIFNYFINKLIVGKYFESKNEEELSIEYIYKILDILNKGFEILNQIFFAKYFNEFMLPKIKNILLKISKDKKKNISMMMVSKILEISQKFVGLGTYIFQQPKILLEFIIKFGINCFKENENLEKRLIGLNSILTGLKLLDFFTNNKIFHEYNILFYQNMLCDDNNDFFHLLFNKSDVHDQLILKGKEVIITLYKNNLLDSKDINKLYNFAISSQEGSESCNQLYSILTEISRDMSIEQSQSMIDKIITFPIEQIRKDDVNLIFSLIQFIKSEKDYKKTITTALDYIYNFIISDLYKGKNFISDFTKTISYLQSEDNIFFACYYFEKIINELLKKINLRETEFFYDFLSYFILSFGQDIKENMKFKAMEYLIQNNNSKKLLDNFIENVENNSEEISIERKINYIIAILESIKSILCFTELKNFLNTDSIMKLCDIFIFQKKKQIKQADFIRSINFFQRNNLMNIEEFCEEFFEKFDAYISEINKDNYLEYSDIIDDEYSEMVLKLYQIVNNLEENTDNDNFINESCYIKKNPLKLKYFEIVWKMCSKINYSSLTEEFLGNFSLRLFSPKERYEIWADVIKKIFDESENFVDPFIALNMIKIIVSVSETFGTGGVISHSLEKIKKIPLKLSIKSKFEPFPDFDITENIYTTSTLYDVKKEIQRKYFLNPILIDFSRLSNIDFHSDSNGKNLCFIFYLENTSTSSLSSLTKEQLENKYTLSMKKSKELSNMKKFPLIDDNNPNSLNQKAITVFKKIFINVTNNTEIMDKKVYKDFYTKTTGVQNMDPEIHKFFDKYDREKKGFWNLENFIEFYLDSYKQNKIYQIFYNLNNLGYRNDLELYNTPFEKNCPLYFEENNISEYMPRYFIGNNLEYMNKLFTFSLSYDKKVHELALKIINELSTLTQMKNLFFWKNQENVKMIDELLEKDNLEMRAYSFSIILSELEKYNETDNKEIQSAINLFIEENLEKIINNLDYHINHLKNEIQKDKNYNNKENTQFIQFLNYYHIIIQIILFSLKRIIDDSNFFDLIQKFDKELEGKENLLLSDISKFKIKEENFKIIKKLDIEKLFNIAISFLLSQKEQIKTVTYDLKFSFNIILLLFIFLEKDINKYDFLKIKENIYNNYISYLIDLCKNPLIKCRKLLQSANELILNLKQSDIEFVSKIEDEMTKEILKYSLLNKPLITKNYLFVIFKDMIHILFKKDENEDNDKLFNLFKSVIGIITEQKEFLREILITDYLEILSIIISKLKLMDNKSFKEYDFSGLLMLLINDYLINTTKKSFIKNYSRYNDKEYIGTLFELIENIISINPNKNIFTFFESNEIKNLKTKHLSILPDDKVNYDPKTESKNDTGYLGLKNLSSLCYMNSVIQQLYMIPIFRKSILNLKINDKKYKLQAREDVDDLLFQLMKMFYYLTFSEKSYYNPKSFVYSFKDYEGNPTNPNVQCDAQEFLTRFIEKIEDTIKNTNERFLCHNILGGTTLQQIICTNTDCKNISERRESIIYLSLDIKGNYSLEDCLDKFIGEEKIEDYHCEKCNKKITHIKKVSIDKLPNILILHLQRIAFNYDTFLMEKINDEVTFEKKLNIKKYTVDKNNKNVDKENYEYEFIGVIIHSGTAQYGHYYSVILNQEKKNENKWYKFNDTSVSESSYDNLKRDIEYNKDYSPSAYMLLYQKKIKNPVLVNIREINENNNILNLLKDEKILNIKDNDIEYEVYKDEKEAIEKNKMNEKNDKEIILNDNKLIGHLISYDEASNYINKINENNKEENIPFKSMILEENIKFCNDKKIYSTFFTYFLFRITLLIKEEIEKNNDLAEKYVPIIKLINDFLFNILSLSWYKDDLKQIIDNLISIIKNITNILSYLIKDILEPKKEIFLHDFLLTKDIKLGESMSTYFANILILSIENNIETEASFQLIKFYIDKIPVDISKKWSEMEFFNKFILTLIENSEQVKKKFLSEEIISKLIDFILGKESPLYKGDERNDNKNLKGKLGPLIRAIALLYQYYVKNKEKDSTLKISDQDEKMINHIPFYEKIILDNYDEEGSSILINLKIDSSLNKDEPINKDGMDLIVKLKIPSSRSVNNIISCLSLIEKILDSFKEEKEQELMNILFGIPTLKVESEEAKICYVSGSNFMYYSILNNIANKKDINEDTISLLLNIFKLLYKYPKVFEYLYKLPAPNSSIYSYQEYLFKLYLETKEKIEANIDNDNIKYDKNLFNDLNSLMNDFCDKYKIDLEIIKNDYRICINDYMHIFTIKFELITEIKNINDIILNNLNNYQDKIKVFHIRFLYHLTKNLYKTNFRFFTERCNITYYRSCDTNNPLSKLNLPEYCLEGLFILGNKDCNLSFTIEPYIYSKMEIPIKQYEKYILFIKDFNLLNNSFNDNDKNDEPVSIDFNLIKLKINEVKKEQNNEISEYSEINKLQVNEDALLINCPVCGTANTIDEDNQTFQCFFCSASLL